MLDRINLIPYLKLKKGGLQMKGFTIEQVARATGKHWFTINRHIHKGKLKAAKVGNQYIITRPDLTAYLGSEERVNALFGQDEGIMQYRASEKRILKALGIPDEGQSCPVYELGAHCVITVFNRNELQCFKVKPFSQDGRSLKINIIDKKEMSYDEYGRRIGKLIGKPNADMTFAASIFQMEART